MNLNKHRDIPCVLQHLPTQFMVDIHSILLIGYHQLSIICWETQTALKTTLGSFKWQKIAGLSRLAASVAHRTLHVHSCLCMRSLISQYRDDLMVTIAEVRFISQ